MQKILYFTAGQMPTEGEQIEIDALAGFTSAAFELGIRAPGSNYAGDPEDADFVAGTPPEPYDDGGTYPVFDPDAPPSPSSLPANTSMVYAGQEIAGDGGTFTVSITDGVVGGTWAAD